MDISITSCLKRGEKRSNYNFTRLVPGFPEYPEKVNVKARLLQDRKHAGLIFRKAMGGFEKKGRPCHFPDWFE